MVTEYPYHFILATMSNIDYKISLVCITKQYSDTATHNSGSKLLLFFYDIRVIAHYDLSKLLQFI